MAENVRESASCGKSRCNFSFPALGMRILRTDGALLAATAAAAFIPTLMTSPESRMVLSALVTARGMPYLERILRKALLNS